MRSWAGGATSYVGRAGKNRTLVSDFVPFVRDARRRGVAVAIALLATWTSAVVATGCGQSPTASSGAEEFVSVTVMDRIRRPIAGALVAVVNGSRAGMTQVTDASGVVQLRIPPDPPLIIRASKEGFQSKTETVSGQSVGGNPRFYVWLDSSEPPVELEPGDYTLTLSIDLSTATTWMPQAPCAGFPVEFASRNYRVTITESSSPWAIYNRVVTADTSTLTWPVLFAFGVTGQFVGFEWDDPLTEALPEFRNVMIGGSAPTAEPAVAAGASVSVPFHGSFEYCQTKFGHAFSCWHQPAERIIAFHSCSSGHATMVFTRR